MILLLHHKPLSRKPKSWWHWNITQVYTASSHHYNSEFNQPGALFALCFQWRHNVGDVNLSNYVLKDFQSNRHTTIWRVLSYETWFVRILQAYKVNVLKSTGDMNDDGAKKKIHSNSLKLITEEWTSQSTQLKFHTRLRCSLIGFQTLYCSTLAKWPCFSFRRHAEICAYFDKKRKAATQDTICSNVHVDLI